MKRITLTSAEYGLAFGVDRAIRDLAAAGLLSAVGCIAASDLWSREYLPLRQTIDKAGHATLIGVTLALTQPWAPVSDEAARYFERGFPSRRWYGWRNRLHLLPEDALSAEIAAQIDRFEDYYGKAPDFLLLADELMAFSRLARIVLEVAASRRKKPMIVSPFTEDGPARRFRRKVEKAGLGHLPRGRDLPLATEREKLEAHVWSGFDGLPDQAMSFCFPAEADDRLRRLEPVGRVEARRSQSEFLASDRFNILLLNKDLFLF